MFPCRNWRGAASGRRLSSERILHSEVWQYAGSGASASLPQPCHWRAYGPRKAEAGKAAFIQPCGACQGLCAQALPGKDLSGRDCPKYRYQSNPSVKALQERDRPVPSGLYQRRACFPCFKPPDVFRLLSAGDRRICSLSVSELLRQGLQTDQEGLAPGIPGSASRKRSHKGFQVNYPPPAHARWGQSVGGRFCDCLRQFRIKAADLLYQSAV